MKVFIKEYLGVTVSDEYLFILQKQNVTISMDNSWPVRIPFRDRLGSNNRQIGFNILALLIIPVIVTLVEFLSTNNANFRDMLKLDISHSTLLQYFSSPFVHEDFNHFSNDLIGYLIIVGFTLLLALILNRVRLFSILLLLLSFSFGIISSVVRVLLYPSLGLGGKSCGLSGIDAVLLGLMAVFMLMYLAAIMNQNYYSLLNMTPVILVFLAYLLLIEYEMAVNLPLSQVSIAIILLTALLIFYIFLIRDTLTHLIRYFSHFTKKKIFDVILLVLFVIIFVISFFAFFPTSVRTETGIVDIFMHIFGITFGLYVPSFIIPKLSASD